MEKLFFEFLQVAVGNRKSLSVSVTDADWHRLFEFCKRQALIGVGFTAVEKLHAMGAVCPAALRMQWMALALQIEKRNGLLNEQCKKLAKRYEHDGLSTCILKGQGNCLNYPEGLRTRRMPGDIDVWATPIKDERLRGDDFVHTENTEGHGCPQADEMGKQQFVENNKNPQMSQMDTDGCPQADGGVAIAVQTGKEDVEYVEYHGRKAVIEYVRMQHRLEGNIEKPVIRYHHIEAPKMEGTEVEVHFRPCYAQSPLRNWRMQRWFEEHADVCMKNKTHMGFAVPTASVNVVYQMCHLFSHYFDEGIGLRQLMDYYFALMVWHNDVMECKDLQSQGMWSEGLGTPVMSKEEVMAVIRSFGMGKFAGAVMWVLNEVFVGGNENENGPRRTRRDTDGGPQADYGKECESSEFKRNLNGCPQADSFGERQLENNKNPQMTQMDTDGCPQADFVGEEGLINDERLLINDGVHTENAEGKGGPQADEVGEQQLSKIGQQLKEKFVCQRRTRRETDGGPQADCFGEREFSGINRELKEIGPQADSFGERQLENNKYPQMIQMDTDECPQADGVGEQQLSKIGQQLKENNFAPWMICEPNEKEGRKLLEEIMKGGNFGQYDTRDAALKRGGMMKHGIWKLKRVMRLVRSYPEEALWEPVFRVYHLLWRMIHR